MKSLAEEIADSIQEAMPWKMHGMRGVLLRTIKPVIDKFAADSARLDWLDNNCSFVADDHFKIGPFKVGELRLMADEGIRQSKSPQ